MDRYRIPVKFMMKGYVDTPCKDLKSAVAYALHPDTPLPLSLIHIWLGNPKGTVEWKQ